MTNRLAFAFVGVSTYETSGLCDTSFQLFIAKVPLLLQSIKKVTKKSFLLQGLPRAVLFHRYGLPLRT
ncbi:hypothetical protein [Fulvivirga ligni]|uniref:hypothetical protein n=1 Tax=Fulvivirga ligni TaxID=2904246 RepID=UPI001F1F8409|nr:hypothetical protein [Fulvivirga ligni]UII19847.1 hypothetical protein LVD16_18555 [Fulvivirga ligni]